MEGENMRLYSKKGIIIGSVLWESVLFTLFCFIFLPGEANEGEEYLIAGLIFAAISAFIAWLWFGTYYEIGEEYLKIVSGPIRSKVQISFQV
jgi:hypothetical protein